MGHHESDAPRVSVIVPCYNLGAYLDEAVESVQAQTFQDFEIVIVDDGSSDSATQSRLANYHRPRTRVIQTDHRGLAAARNLGVARAHGDYLCALDADDRLEPSFLAKTVQALESDPAVTFVSTWLRTFGSDEWDWQPSRCDLPTLLWEDTVLTAALVRREAVVSAGGYDETMPVPGDEDWDLWLTLVEQGHRGIILPEILFNYRRRPGSMSTVCWHGPGHLPLASYRMAKHSATYRKHLVEVLLHQDADASALLRRNDQLERYLTSELEPAIAARREELATLRTRLAMINTVPEKSEEAADRAAMARQIEDLAHELRATSAEVAALRSSKSWRITGPLRRAYEWWLRWMGPA